ncbi:MAG: DUF3253 domain-containing protein [Gracilimonas sp.]|uniref:DUF3253 domain-containing protein n=1 Tax=Gracilimonas sp. TaxID=1974203 RepID=UPI0019BC5CD9|nr:DUF3253 domain-containing protein [Gracilimonas sp.]MBD3616518.1 DUF3253 domain-containing protein [Gracilimonas sp.]
MINRDEPMEKSKKEIRSRILSFTKQRSPEKSVSPSEVARDLFSNIWKDHLDEVRTMAGELQSEHLISVSQKSKDVRIDEAKGPIRLSLMKSDK